MANDKSVLLDGGDQATVPADQLQDGARSMMNKLRSIGDGEALEGISEECKVLARVAGVGAGCVVSITLFEILHWEVRRVRDGP